MPNNKKITIKSGDKVCLKYDVFKTFHSLGERNNKPVIVDKYLPDAKVFMLKEKRGGYWTWSADELVLLKNKSEIDKLAKLMEKENEMD